jgi:hypothetical protein
MNSNQLFDEHIKNQLEEYSPTVHPNIWENIANKKDKKKPVGFWFTFLNNRNIFILSTLLIAGSGGAFLLLKNTPATMASAKNTANTQIQPATSTNNNHTINTEVKNTTNNSNTNTTPTTPSNNSVTTANVPAAISPANADDATTFTQNNILRTTKKTYKIKTHSAIAQSDDEGINTAKKIKQHTNVVPNEYSTTVANELNSTVDLLQQTSLQKLFFIATKNSSQQNIALLQKNFLPTIFLPGCPSVEKNAAGNKTYVEVYGGPDIAFSNYSDTGNSAYLQKRKESTTFSSAYSVGLRYTKVFNNGMSVRTGINYSQINEKFKFVQGNLVQVTYIINANGDTTGSYVTTGTRYKTTYNKFKTIDIPLVMGYEVGNGKLHANINAGAIINLYSWQKGEVLDANYQPVSITTGKSSSPYQYKNNIGLGFIASASIYYKLTEKMHILAEPYFRYSLAPMSKENLTFKQKYNTAGLRLGIRIDLQ